jgi:hypothetical protein
MYHKKEQGQPETEYKRGKRMDRTSPPGRGYLPQRAPKEHIEITLDTVIPPMPDKKEILAKPNWESKYLPEYNKFREENEKLRKERVIN